MQFTLRATGGTDMTIYFVRHGDPDYKNDCLTEIGRAQAEAAAKRVCTLGIEHIFSSTNGRALETAKFTAEPLGMDITHCDFMREIAWRSKDDEPIPENGHPWRLSTLFASEGRTLTEPKWRDTEPFCRSVIVSNAEKVQDGFDALMSTLGFTREGEYYRVSAPEVYKKIAIFSHGGSSSVVLAHLLNIPFPQLAGFLRPGFTSITAVTLNGNVGDLVYPILNFANDTLHLKDLNAKNRYD